MQKVWTNKQFIKGDMQRENKHIEMCLTSLVIRKCKLNLKWYHYLHAQMSKIKKIINIKIWQRCGTTVCEWMWTSLIHRNTRWYGHFEKSLAISYNGKDTLGSSNFSANERNESIHPLMLCTPVFIAALLVIVKSWKKL